MKILYAASNSCFSLEQLKRIRRYFNQHELKIAAHSSFFLNEVNFDWNLESLRDWKNPNSELISFNNWNYNILVKEIKDYAPDLIINDLDIHIGWIALELKIPLWNISPLLLYHAMEEKIKYSLGIYKTHSYLINKNYGKKNYLNYLIDNSDKNLIISPFCELKSQLKINDGFTWVRPDFVLAKDGDCFGDLKITKSSDFDNYETELSNCDRVICPGSSHVIADAIYNLKKIQIIVDHNSLESVLNFSMLKYLNNDCSLQINDDIKFFGHQLREFK